MILMNNQEKQFAAEVNYFNAVERISKREIKDDTSLFGVKNTFQIPESLIDKLEESGKYQLHTLDKCSLGGRAIDLKLINPITGNYMTGSSSGTAINVFMGINDFGIGTDGGGSVLAPAASLNLYGIISPLFEAEHMRQYQKVSTDNISFYPSLGYITDDYGLLKELVEFSLDVDCEHYQKTRVETADDIDVFAERNVLIEYLHEKLEKCDVLVADEIAVDVEGFGDSVFGHFDKRTKKIQKKASKGLLRVANMVGATAMVIPQKELGTAKLLMCKSNCTDIRKMIDYSEKYLCSKDELCERYFKNVANYRNKYKGEV